VLPAITVIGKNVVRFMPSDTFDVGWTLTGDLTPAHDLGEQLAVDSEFETKHREDLRNEECKIIVDSELEGPTSTGKLTFAPKSNVKNLKTEFTTTKNF
jgi:hypothetical protein